MKHPGPGSRTSPAGVLPNDTRKDTAMPYYRKKPVVIEARQLTPVNYMEIAVWCGGIARINTVEIPTLEGTMTASPGDWIIRGVQGEFYPIKPDIFAATYEEVTD